MECPYCLRTWKPRYDTPGDFNWPEIPCAICPPLYRHEGEEITGLVSKVHAYLRQAAPLGRYTCPFVRAQRERLIRFANDNPLPVRATTPA